MTESEIDELLTESVTAAMQEGPTGDAIMFLCTSSAHKDKLWIVNINVVKRSAQAFGYHYKDLIDFHKKLGDCIERMSKEE